MSSLPRNVRKHLGLCNAERSSATSIIHGGRAIRWGGSPLRNLLRSNGTLYSAPPSSESYDSSSPRL